MRMRRYRWAGILLSRAKATAGRRRAAWGAESGPAFSYPDATTPHAGIHALESAGGWMQLKAMPTEALSRSTERWGQDENFREQFRELPLCCRWVHSAQEKTAPNFVNFIYKPKLAPSFRSGVTAVSIRFQATNVFGGRVRKSTSRRECVSNVALFSVAGGADSCIE